MKKCLSLLATALILFSCSKDENGRSLIRPSITATSPYNDPIWHPSGEIIGFNYLPVVEIHAEVDGWQYAWYYDVDLSGFWLIDADGANMRWMLPYYLNTPAWSPDGKWIAFSNNAAQICIMPFDGEQFDTTAVQVLTDRGRNFFPAWSPDGTWIVYDSNEDNEKGQYFIWKIKTDGSIKRRIVYTPYIGEARMPYWKQDFSILHQRFTGEGMPEIFQMDSTGDNVIRITNNNLFEVKIQSTADNKYLTYISYDNKLTLNRIDISSNEIIKLANWCANYSWSPDGKKIVYLNFYDTHIDETTGSFWTMDSDGGNKKPLTYNSFKLVQAIH